MRPPALSRLRAAGAIIVPVTILAATVSWSPAPAPGGAAPASPAAHPRETGHDPGEAALHPADPAPYAGEAAPHPGDPAPDPRDEAAAAALEALSPHVRRLSDPEALRVAFRAYFNYRSAFPEQVRKPYLYFVDLGLDNRTARGYVFDMGALALVDGPFTVAHGSGSSRERNAVPTSFSNRPGSLQSSLGLYLAEETYVFRGRAAGGAYTSVGLRMRGESGIFNDAARRRGIVAHGAPYVSAADAGRSEGCPAMEQHRARRLLPLLADGGVVFIFSPRDGRWLREDPWIHAE